MQRLIWIVVAVVVIGGGAWWFTSQQAPAPVVVDNSMTLGGDTNTTSARPDTTSSNTDTGAQVGVDVNVNTAPMSATVTYNGSSFSPSEVTIKKGSTVTFTGTSGSMWVASGPHPAHTNYSGLTLAQHCPDTSNDSFDQCAASNSYTFMFNKVGTWPYHNHANATVFGRVVVVE